MGTSILFIPLFFSLPQHTLLRVIIIALVTLYAIIQCLFPSFPFLSSLLVRVQSHDTVMDVI